jgi:hypothetical protein
MKETRSMITHVDDAKKDEKPGDALTEAQREFAKLLGRLLAQRWREEHTATIPKKSERRETEDVPKP